MAKPLDLALEDHLLRARLDYVKALKESLADPESEVSLALEVYSSIVDELIDEIAADVADRVQRGLEDVAEPHNVMSVHTAAPPVKPKGPSQDVFGVPVNAMPIHPVACPSCGRHVAASRFAPHLEKCLLRGRTAVAGGGRGSS